MALESWPDPRIKSEGRLVPAIHILSAANEDVDGRDKRGHDDSCGWGRLKKASAALAEPAWSTRWKEPSMASTSDRDPRHQTQKMRKALKEIRDHLRDDIDKVDEPQLKAMFETAAEVLGGLEKAFHDYEQKNESAWRS